MRMVKKMTNNDKKVFGEDKLGKLVRLMKRYENQVQSDIVDDRVHISVQIESDGNGRLMTGILTVYDFIDTEGLFRFLESGQLVRTLMSRG